MRKSKRYVTLFFVPILSIQVPFFLLFLSSIYPLWKSSVNKMSIGFMYLYKIIFFSGRWIRCFLHSLAWWFHYRVVDHPVSTSVDTLSVLFTFKCYWRTWCVYFIVVITAWQVLIDFVYFHTHRPKHSHYNILLITL